MFIKYNRDTRVDEFFTWPSGLDGTAIEKKELFTMYEDIIYTNEDNIENMYRSSPIIEDKTISVWKENESKENENIILESNLEENLI